jgi:hypothetical protein
LNAKKIYKTLKTEWINNPDFYSAPSWGEFILTKDLGLICVDSWHDTYTIIDRKKWAIAKIKYGF